MELEVNEQLICAIRELQIVSATPRGSSGGDSSPRQHVGARRTSPNRPCAQTRPNFDLKLGSVTSYGLRSSSAAANCNRMPMSVPYRANARIGRPRAKLEGLLRHCYNRKEYIHDIESPLQRYQTWKPSSKLMLHASALEGSAFWHAIVRHG